MKHLILLACSLFVIGCASSQANKPATKLSGDELSNLIAQYEQEQDQQSNAN